MFASVSILLGGSNSAWPSPAVDRCAVKLSGRDDDVEAVCTLVSSGVLEVSILSLLR
jgi:hypothetical protein